MATTAKTKKATDYGSIRNEFGLLTKDYLSVDTNKFLAFITPTGVSREELAKKLGVSRPSLYQEKISLSRSDINDRIIPLVTCCDLAVELFKDKKIAHNWIIAPNVYFMGDSPFQLTMNGSGRLVIESLLDWLGKRDGQAF